MFSSLFVVVEGGSDCAQTAWPMNSASPSLRRSLPFLQTASVTSLPLDHHTSAALKWEMTPLGLFPLMGILHEGLWNGSFNICLHNHKYTHTLLLFRPHWDWYSHLKEKKYPLNDVKKEKVYLEKHGCHCIFS